MRNYDTGQYWDDSLTQASGCAPISDGCRRCWSAQLAWLYSSNGRKGPYAGQLVMGPHGPQWNGVVRLTNFKDPPASGHRRIMLTMMGDSLYDKLPVDLGHRVLKLVQSFPQHVFMLPTKRPHNAHLIFPDHRTLNRIAPNLWMIVSIENDAELDHRLQSAWESGFAKTLISFEPLLGPIDLGAWASRERDGENFISGVIIGGENGRRARPCHPAWINGIIDTCEFHDIPIFFKGWGEYGPADGDFYPPTDVILESAGINGSTIRAHMRQMGKVRSGRTINNRTYNEFPRSVTDSELTDLF